jgi:hypothetical protein
MWTVVYMAQNKESVSYLAELLENQGILVKIRATNQEAGEDSCFEVLVPESEVDQAHDILIDAQL